MRSVVRKRLASLTLIDLAIGTAAVVAASPANAQGAPAYSWTGYYIGGHVGYRWGIADFSSPSSSADTPASNSVGSFATYPPRNQTFNANGGFGGVHFGYNWQLNPSWLVGLEGDFSVGRKKTNVITTGTLTDSENDGFSFRHNNDVTLTWQSSLRARAGWVMQSSLWYVTGGAAFARVKWRDESLALDPGGGEPPSAVHGFSTTNTTRLGWVVGAGFEQMMAPNWTWRVEYLYEDFGSFDVGQGFNSTGKFDLAVHKVRVGITIKAP